MSDGELQSFETELASLRPAKPPEDFLARLTSTVPPAVQPSCAPRSHSVARPRRGFGRFLASRIGAPWRLPGWFAAAAATVVVLGLLAWLAFGPEANSGRPMVRADRVEFGQDLVATFDAVAKLPSGQPVRFRCRQWSDQMVMRDSRKGLVIEERTPRLEIVPVCFETY